MRLTGIEITEEGVAAVTLERQGTGLRVVAFAQVGCHEVESDVSGMLHARLLSALAEKMPLKGEKCCVVLSPEMVRTRGASFPFQDAKKIEKALPFELEPTLPFSLEGLDISWEKRSLTSGKGGSDVLAFISNEKELKALREVFQGEGIDVRELVPSLAPAVSVHARRVQGRFVIMECREHGASFVIVSDGKMVVTRHIRYQNVGSAESVSREIWQTLTRVAEEEGTFLLPEKIVVSGGPLDLKTVETPLGAIAVEPVHMLSLTGAVVDEELKGDWKEGPFDSALAVAASTLSGWRHTTIWEQGFAPAEFMGKHKKRVVATAVMLLFVLLLFGVRSGLAVRHNSRALASVESQMSRLYLDTFKDVGRAPSPEVMVRSMEGRLRQAREGAAYAGGRERRVEILELLYALSSSIPNELKVSLKRLVLTRGKLTVSGLADDFAVIDTMKRSLEKSPMISGVTIASSSKEVGGERFQFKVVIALSGGEAS
ncbi:MAG: PilN domain-containing protein [Desulfobacterales bacterium]|nr:PilN domain-containing protein [Desulfobacterales bacterium]